MPTINEDASQATSWKIKVGVFRGLSPKWAGNRNVAVLRRGAENTLTLDTGYDLPSTAWRILMAIAVVILTILAVVMKGQPASHLSADGAAAIFAIYALILWSHHRAMTLDLGSAVSEVIVDDKRCRIALLAPVNQKPRWIVLSEFRYSFSEVSAAIRDVVGAKCRPGPITEGNWLPLIIVLAVIAACALAFGFSP